MVTAKVNALCYRIQKSSTSRSMVVHVDHLKLYEGNNPVENCLKSDVPREDSEDSGVEFEMVTENQNASTGVTDQTSKKSGLIIPDNVIPQHSDFDATMPYETTSMPSADMDETIPYGMDKQIMPDPDLMPPCHMRPLPNQCQALTWMKRCHMVWMSKLYQILI